MDKEQSTVIAVASAFANILRRLKDQTLEEDEIIEMIIRDPNNYGNLAFATNVKVSSRVLEALVEHSTNDRIILDLSKNPNLPTASIKMLVERYSTKRDNSEDSIEVLTLFYYLIESPNTDKEINDAVFKWITSQDFGVSYCYKLVDSPKTDIDTLLKIEQRFIPESDTATFPFELKRLALALLANERFIEYKYKELHLPSNTPTEWFKALYWPYLKDSDAPF